MVVSPQSYGDLIVPHAHAHAVVSLGLFRKDGRYFPMDDIDFSGLEELFRERFFQMMLKKEKIRPETVERFRSWRHSGFNVNFDRRLEADDRAGLEGLLCYIERPVVSLRRLTYRDDGLVHYQGTKLHPRLGIDHQLVPSGRFAARNASGPALTAHHPSGGAGRFRALRRCASSRLSPSSSWRCSFRT